MSSEIKLVSTATHTGLTLTWKDVKGTAYNLTGATVTGRAKNIDLGTVRALTGTFALVTAASGIFSYTPSTADLSVTGNFLVQFIATYTDATKDLTYTTTLEIAEVI